MWTHCLALTFSLPLILTHSLPFLSVGEKSHWELNGEHFRHQSMKFQFSQHGLRIYISTCAVGDWMGT